MISGLERVGDIVIGDRVLDFDDVVAVSQRGARVSLAPEALARIDRARRHIDALGSSGRTVYGVTTGFGALATTKIPPDARVKLQYSIVRSHSAGMGPAIDREVVRAMLLLRARTLAAGISGARAEVVTAIVDLLNAGIVPFVPRYGSLGASGDLAPLAHAALCLLGEGSVIREDGSLEDAGSALRVHGLRPLTLQPKEGVSLVNGTDGMLAMLVLACVDAERLFKTADVLAALSVEALLGTDGQFSKEVHRLRPHPGQSRSAANLARLLAASPIVRSHRDSDHLVQDPYSVRCHPQVVGAARDTLEHATNVARRELASAVDSPAVLDDGRIESNGNFHGEPLAFAADFLAIAAAEVGAIAERRVDRMLDPVRSQGLPAFLAAEPGIDSGLMIAGYTAAALVAENRRLAAPASVDSLPTSGMQEDHVSMGWAATCKLRDSLANLARILAVEALVASQGVACRRPLAPAAASGAAARAIAEIAPGPRPDHPLSEELAACERLVAEGAILRAAEGIIGPLE